MWCLILLFLVTHCGTLTDENPDSEINVQVDQACWCRKLTDQQVADGMEQRICGRDEWCININESGEQDAVNVCLENERNTCFFFVLI